MDFKSTVISDTDSKYLDMANGRTAAPFKGSVSILDHSSYKLRKNTYLRRLENEKANFNNAIKQVKKTRDDRIRAETEHKAMVKRDRKRMGFCWCVLLLTFLIVVPFVFIVIQNGIGTRLLDVMMHELSFDYFLAAFNSTSRGNSGVEVGVLSMILGGIAWLSLLIFAIVKKHQEDRFGWLIGILLGGLLFSGASIIIPIFLMRVLLFLLVLATNYLLSRFGVLVLGIVALILLIIKFRAMEMKRFKFQCICSMVLLFFMILIHWNLSSEFGLSASESYYSHNGTSESKAVYVEAGESYLAQIKEDGGKYYFRFYPDKSGVYTICSLDDQETQVKLYSELGDMSVADISKGNGFTITEYLESNKTYYICVSYIGDYHGHFMVDIVYEE